MDTSASAGPPQSTPPTDDLLVLNGSDRRRELRQRLTNGSVVIEGRSYEIFDWSSSGVCVHDFDADAEDGHRTPAAVRIALPDATFDFSCELILVRRDPFSNLLAGVFTALSRPDRVAIAAHFEALQAAADESLRALLTGR